MVTIAMIVALVWSNLAWENTTKRQLAPTNAWICRLSEMLVFCLRCTNINIINCGREVLMQLLFIYNLLKYFIAISGGVVAIVVVVVGNHASSSSNFPVRCNC